MRVSSEPMSWRWPWLALVLVFVVAIPRPSSSVPDQVPRLWMINGGYHNQIRYAQPEIAHRLFLSLPSVIVGVFFLRDYGRGTRFEAGSWPSFRSFERILHPRNWVVRGLVDAMYDPEDWHATPHGERQDPVAYFARFSTVARDNGWSIIISPQPNLTLVPGAACHAGPGESEYDAFLRCDLIGAAAAHADVVEVQAQGLQGDPAAYRAFVIAAATQAREANPSVRVISGLTTGEVATAEQMYAAWDSVRDVVDGFYLSIGGNDRLPTALRFVRMLPLPGR
jgi:hypothetical protein